jgi:membrane-bound serine protease (ClpP class)
LKLISRSTPRDGSKLAVLAFVAILLVLPIFSSTFNSRPIIGSVAQGTSTKEVVVIQLYEEIDFGSANMITRGISQAEADHAAAVIIDMNTPGGILSDMVTMINSINSSTVPVYTFVGNDSSAASAGSYVAMATNRIFMAPSAVIGPSTPYIIGGTALEQAHVENYTLALMDSLAAGYGRNVSAVSVMVTDNKAYYGSQAVALHVADNSSHSLSETVKDIGLSGARVVTVGENLSEQILSFLANSTVDGILILVGIIAIVLDFLHPTILLSIAGVVCIALGLIGAETIQGPTAALAVPLILFVLAATLIVFELKTGHGFMLFAGVVAGAFATILLAYQVPYSPSPIGQLQYVEIGVFVAFGAVLAFYARWVAGALRKKAITGIESVIGREVNVSTDLSPEGEVTVDGIVWKARLVNGEIAHKGEKVVVKEMQGLTLLVEPQSIKEKTN